MTTAVTLAHIDAQRGYMILIEGVPLVFTNSRHLAGRIGDLLDEHGLDVVPDTIEGIA